MRSLPLRVRLSLWYFVSLVLMLGLFAGFSWFAMKRSMYAAIDQDLSFRLRAVEPLITAVPPGHLASPFANVTNTALSGTILQITNDGQDVLYQSRALSSHHVTSLPPAPADGTLLYGTFGSRGWPVRVVSQRVDVRGTSLTVHVVEPLRTLLTSLRRYSIALALAFPVVIAIGTAVGHWISARALAPVYQLRKEADAIGADDLAARVSVPPSRDEVRSLAMTLNAMLARIERSFQAVQQFTADASHELRSPLALIQAAAEISLRKQRSAEELVEAHRKILSATRDMTKTVEDLLLLAREDAKVAAYDLESIDLRALLDSITSELTSTAEAKQISLTCSFSHETSQVIGNANALQRLFVILIDNAIKYTEEGCVDVSLISRGESSEVVISDTGIGMTEDALPHMFERFWRADQVRSRNGGGAGLGLSLAKQIAERHQARISVQSRSGIGSRISVTFPSRS